jgi:hypothetical protein
MLRLKFTRQAQYLARSTETGGHALLQLRRRIPSGNPTHPDPADGTSPPYSFTGRIAPREIGRRVASGAWPIGPSPIRERRAGNLIDGVPEGLATRVSTPDRERSSQRRPNPITKSTMRMNASSAWHYRAICSTACREWAEEPLDRTRGPGIPSRRIRPTVCSNK